MTSPLETRLDGGREAGGDAGATTGTMAAVDVSLIELIANPDRYDGREVMVDGFLDTQTERPALYLHKEDFDKELLMNAVLVDLRDAGVHATRGYVLIRATFRATPKAHLGGMLANVQKLMYPEEQGIFDGGGDTTAPRVGLDAGRLP